MTEEEKIRAEVERLRALTADPISNPFDLVLHFIDSLPEEKVSEDLEEAAEEYASVYKQVGYDEDHILSVSDSYIAGADWQKEHTIDKACEWLKENMNKYIHHNYVTDALDVEKGIYQDFRKAMED